MSGEKLPIKNCRASIASRAHAHGVSIVRAGVLINTMPAVELCQIVAGAIDKATAKNREQVESHIRAIARGIGSTPGPLLVSQTSLSLLRGVANPKGKA